MYQKLIRLDCKNIVRFYDTVAQDGRFYAVEEFINGGSTLREYMERRGPLSDLETKNIALQICNGLKQVHKLGIVHRDINPNNIMLAADGTVKIIDFGISRTVKRNQSCDTEILGTQGFTAPEQFGFHQTGPKADIYSMGVLINVMATGCLPGVQLVNGWLSEIVLKCTQIDETNRYKNIDDLYPGLGAAQQASAAFAHRPRLSQGDLVAPVDCRLVRYRPAVFPDCCDVDCAFSVGRPVHLWLFLLRLCSAGAYPDQLFGLDPSDRPVAK